MSTILVDYENVSGSNGLKGADALRSDDTLIIFYSGSCERIRYDYLQEIRESGCEFQTIKLKGMGKNALDFYIAAECGMIVEKGEKEIAIISNDKGFQAVIDFFGIIKNTKKIQIVRAGNIENAVILFQAPENAERRKMLQNRKVLLDLAVESARIAEQNRLKKELKSILVGTDYEKNAAKIIDFMEMKKNQGKKALYTGALHEFGREDGRVIYQLLKDRINNQTMLPI